MNFVEKTMRTPNYIDSMYTSENRSGISLGTEISIKCPFTHKVSQLEEFISFTRQPLVPNGKAFDRIVVMAKQ